MTRNLGLATNTPRASRISTRVCAKPKEAVLKHPDHRNSIRIDIRCPSGDRVTAEKKSRSSDDTPHGDGQKFAPRNKEIVFRSTRRMVVVVSEGFSKKCRGWVPS